MAVDLVLLLRGQSLVSVEVRRVLDAVLGESQVQVLAVELVAAHRNQAGVHAEQAVVNLNEGGLARLVVNEDFLDAAQLVASVVVCGCLEKILDVVAHFVNKSFHLVGTQYGGLSCLVSTNSGELRSGVTTAVV